MAGTALARGCGALSLPLLSALFGRFNCEGRRPGKGARGPTKFEGAGGGNTTPPMDSQILCLAIVIEKGGPSPIENPILAIGVCLGTANGVILEKKTWCLSPFPGQKIAPEQIETMTDKISRVSCPPLHTLCEFDTWLRRLSVTFLTKTIVVVSGNPVETIGFLDYVMISRGVRTQSVCYLGDKVCREAVQPATMLIAQATFGAVFKWGTLKARSENWPDSFAECEYWLYLGARKARRLLEQGLTAAEIGPELENE